MKKLNGRSFASVKAWGLVFMPPLIRPISRPRSPFLSSASMPRGASSDGTRRSSPVHLKPAPKVGQRFGDLPLIEGARCCQVQRLRDSAYCHQASCHCRARTCPLAPTTRFLVWAGLHRRPRCYHGGNVLGDISIVFEPAVSPHLLHLLFPAGCPSPLLGGA